VTAIAAVIDPATGDVLMGCDANVNRGSFQYRGSGADPKVFAVGEMVVGAAGLKAAGHALRFGWDPPARPRAMDELRYMADLVAPSARARLEDAGVKPARSDMDAEALVGYRGRIFHIGTGCEVTEPDGHYHCIGCAVEILAGALFVLDHLAPHLDAETRLRGALEAAVCHGDGIAGPFTIIRTREAP
jgi:hypothetical protein